ncbi:class I SAM-dependent methyltransferase [Oscillatoria sp. HE19RPO]|uniref:class I SAM-dependent methyltransferase n=1 Tax=Oscillatoria sp. HE19RPO TaxID=2954806 RepID=UPI0020C36046|nr:methyltransferase domain-containing protein [Oscillatoria sp. HE19RPO]
MTHETLLYSAEDFENKADTGLIMSSLQWLIDHYIAKEKYRLQMVRDLQLKPGNLVLDVGSGPGLWSEKLAEKVAPDGRIIGIDFSQDLIEYARENLQQSPYKDFVEYQRGDFFDLPFERNTFDVVFCSNSLMYLTDEDKEKVIKEKQRVAKIGGKVASKEYDGETIIVYPIPPELWLKMKSAVARVLSETASSDYYDEYVARKTHKIFLDVGLTHIDSIAYPIQLSYPLSPSAKRYLTQESEWLIKTASPYLSAAETEQLMSYFNPNSQHYVLDREDFWYLVVEIMALGIKQ